MTTVDEIEAAITTLTTPDRRELFRRLFEKDGLGNEGRVDEVGNDAWDRQMIADAKAGLFDEMLRAVDADIRAGRTGRPREVNDNRHVPNEARGPAEQRPPDGAASLPAVAS